MPPGTARPARCIPPPELTEFIRRQARDLGADLVGFAPAAIPADAAGGPRAFQEWIDEGLHGTMNYMARRPERRASLTQWFPPAKSVVLVGYCYAPPEEGGEPDCAGGGGRIARYARPRDYHDIIRARLKTLQERILAVSPRARAKAFVDTSAVLERLYGRYAGIGWVGKNTMLISARLGSYFFLAGLALDLELAYDEPAPDHCGTCNRCLTACPTGAFARPRVLDAAKCVSYLTIEHRGVIPRSLRPGIGEWVFGCDVCQEVCPWNRFASGNPVLRPRLPARLPLPHLASLSEEQFDREMGDTPLERAGRDGLARNALAVMGNSGDEPHLPLLERFSRDPDPVLSEQARWSLGRLRESGSGARPSPPSRPTIS